MWHDYHYQQNPALLDTLHSDGAVGVYPCALACMKAIAHVGSHCINITHCINIVEALD